MRAASSLSACTCRGSGISGALFQHRDRGELLALEELEEGAATSRYVGDAIRHAVLVERRQGVAAAGDREGLAAGDGLGQRACTLAELVELEHAHRTVPHDGAR